MALHSFALTVNGTVYTCKVVNVTAKMDESTVVCVYRSTYNTPFGSKTQEVSKKFTPAELNAALAQLGEQSYTNALGMKNSDDALAEQLAKNKWETT